MNIKEIRELINLMNENDLTEIEIEREGTKIKIKKTSSEDQESFRKIPADYRIGIQPSATTEEALVKDSDSKRKEIKSPMVGTFYRTPSPDAPPFVECGDVVEIGQVVCIIEAMKLMNEIKSEVKGKIAEILVENAQPVEFGQALFIIEPI